jgi:hypothetical protein
LERFFGNFIFKKWRVVFFYCINCSLLSQNRQCSNLCNY